jgi:hypothetical protein
MTTLQAINGSIKKWEGDPRSMACKLCIHFQDTCDICPLYDLGMGCMDSGSPYEEWSRTIDGTGGEQEAAEVMLIALYLTKEVYVNGDMP